MTVRMKTIEYAFPSYETALASATRYDFAALTIYIPETASRYFRGVCVMVTCRDAVTTAASLTAMLIGCKLGAAAFEDHAVTQTINNTGEQQSFMFTSDFTDYFATNFGSGSSQTLQVGVRFTGGSTINHSVKVLITYAYDDASAGDTRIKTVRIPIESRVSTQGTSLTEWGTNQVPNLDSFLPEASKVYRDIFFELWMNEGTNTTTDSQFGLGLDSESVDNDGLHENGMTSACWYHYIWKRTNMATNAAHAFKAQAPAAMPCHHAACVLVVTYEYNHTNSTSILNSLMMPFDLDPTIVMEYTEKEFKFLITESNISLVQSGVVLHYLIDSGCTVGVAFGGQAVRAYTDPSVLYCGGTSLCQRIDSGGAQGAGISIARGENTLTAYIESSSLTVCPSAIGAVLYLNYTSDKASSGADSHQHTLIHEAVGVQPDARIRGGSSGGFSDLATWYLSAAGVMGYDHQRHTNKPDCGFFFCYDDGAIYRMVASMLGRSDVEVGPAIYAIDLLTKNVKTGASVTPFKQHYDQGWSDDRMSLSDIDRGWGIPQSSIVAGAILVFNVTQIAWTVSGTISGYTGDGSGITVEIFRVDTGEKVLQATTAAGGTFSKTWFENTISLFASARQDSTHAGRSESGVAS